MLQLGFGRIVPKDSRLNIGTGEMSTLSPAVPPLNFPCTQSLANDLHFGRSFALHLFTDISREEDFPVYGHQQIGNTKRGLAH